MQKKLFKTFRNFVPLAIVITGIMGLIYVSVQQSYRQGANDPQIQMAEDAAADLNNGTANLSGLNSLKKVDISNSLSPFYIIFDTSRKSIASDAMLDGKAPPSLPQGIFDFTSIKGKNMFTWQPAGNTRIAAVVVKYGKGYVLAGRSLREVENREESLTHMVGLAWLITLAAAFTSLFLFYKAK